MAASKRHSAPITIDQAQELLRELCLIDNRRKTIMDCLCRCVREHGPVSGSGLYVDNRQRIYPEVPKPALLAEVICDLTEPEGYPAVIRRLLESMPVTTYLSFIKKSGELAAWMQALLPLDEDGGMYMHYGDASIDVRRPPADEKHHVVLPGEKAMGNGHG